jgi:hypothetical protein
MSDPDLIERLIETEPRLAAITAEAVAEALQGFSLPPHKSADWIARAIRGVLFASLNDPEDGPERQADKDTKQELLALAEQVAGAWQSVFQRSNGADSALVHSAFGNGNWLTEEDVIDGVAISEPPEHKAFIEAVQQMDWLAGFLRRAGNAVDVPMGPWRNKIRREERICRAQYLSPVYEKAFSAAATINTWGIDEKPKNLGAKRLGHWADFYQRIVALAFSDKATPDLEGVLDEARRRQRAYRVKFAPGIIPD